MEFHCEMASNDKAMQVVCCDSPSTSKDKVVICGGVCKKKFHAHCAKIDDVLYNGIMTNRNVVFKCSDCRSTTSASELFRTIMNQLNEAKEENRRLNENLLQRISRIENTLEVSGRAVIDKIEKVDDEIKRVDDGLKCVDEKIDEGRWVDVVKKKKKPKNRLKSTVIITPRDNTQRDQLRKTIKEKISADGVEVTGISNAPANGVAIICESENDCAQLINEIESKMPQEVSVTKPKVLNPRIKLLRLHDADEDDNKLAEILKEKNPSIKNAEIKIIKRETVRSNGREMNDVCNVIVEVSPAVHNEIMKTRKLKHTWELVNVVDNVHVKRCYNCMGFNHNASECRNEAACGKCAGKHKTIECDNEARKCINCVRANDRIKSTGHSNFSLDVEHTAWSNKCEAFKRKVEHCKRAVNTLE